MIKLRIRTQKYIAKLTGLLIKLINTLPSNKRQETVKKRLNDFRFKVNPNLFDSESFLYYAKRKKEGLISKLSQIETIAIRGSNADCGFYPQVWQNSYNLGLTSSDLYSSYFLYKNFRYKLSKLKNVILFASVGFIGYSLIHTREKYRAVAYKYFFDIPYAKNELINSTFENFILKKCVKLNPINNSTNYWGYENNKTIGTIISTAKRVRPHLRENKREPDQLEWLVELIDLVQRDNRKLIVVIPPFRSDYKKLLPGQAELFEKIFKIKNITILNFYDSTLFTDGDFVDADHLNETGAIKLTKEIYILYSCQTPL
jgi:hypothetical protein